MTMAMLGAEVTPDQAVASSTSGKYTKVPMTKIFPVYITYFTMGRNIDGAVTTFADIYGRDAPVIAFLEASPDVLRMRRDIARFVADWLPSYVRDNRSYLTVGIGCTGGQHRSVYLAETLCREFAGQAPRVLVRHRGLA